MNPIKHNNNNFDFLRFIAAVAVIVYHSCAVTGNGPLYFYILTKGQLALGDLSVYVFFMISGYLIVGSYLRLNNVFKYLLLRSLRIFPALIVVILLTVFLIGPIITKVPLNTYFHTPLTYTYLKNIFLYPMQYALTGFDTKASSSQDLAINGSLWTLSYEFTCYLTIALFGVFRLLNKYTIILLFVLSLFLKLAFIPVFHPGEHIWLHVWLWKITEFAHLSLESISKFFCYFYAGSLFYIYKDKIVYSYKYALIAAFIIFVCCVAGHELDLILPLFGTYLVFYIAFNEKIKLHNFGKYGDFSYGIYIYGFLIQQLVVLAFHGKMDNTINYLISIPIAIICGILSYHLIEKPCINLKKYIK